MGFWGSRTTGRLVSGAFNAARQSGGFVRRVFRRGTRIRKKVYTLVKRSPDATNFRVPGWVPFANAVQTGIGMYNTFRNFVKRTGPGDSYVKTPNTALNPTAYFSNVKAPTVISTGSTISKSEQIVGKASKRLDKKLEDTLHLKLLQATGSRLISSQNSQGVSELVVGNISALAAITNQVTSAAINNGYTGQTSLKYWITKIEVTTRYTNTGLINAVLDLYHIEPKYITLSSTYPLLADPLNTWNQGLNMQEYSTSSNILTINSLGSTPFLSSMFKIWNKVTSIQRIELTTGSTHVHRQTFYTNKLYDTGMTTAPDGSTVNFGAVPGLSYYTLGILSGQPVHSASSGLVALSDASLDFVRDVTYHVALYTKAGTVDSYTNNLNDVTDPTTVVINTPEAL